MAANVIWSFHRSQWGGNSSVNSVLKNHPYWTATNLNAANKTTNVNNVSVDPFGFYPLR